jgi:hypothetical protein
MNISTDISACIAACSCISKRALNEHLGAVRREKHCSNVRCILYRVCSSRSATIDTSVSVHFSCTSGCLTPNDGWWNVTSELPIAGIHVRRGERGARQRSSCCASVQRLSHRAMAGIDRMPGAPRHRFVRGYGDSHHHETSNTAIRSGTVRSAARSET